MPPKRKQRIGTHHGWCFTISGIESDASINAFVELCNDLAVDSKINIAVVGDELNSSGGRHAQAFLNFPKGDDESRGIAFGELKKMCYDAGVAKSDLHVEPRKSRSMERAGNYCLKEHFEHIAKMFPEKGTVEELFRPDSKPLLVIGWDIERACPDKGNGERARTDLEGFKDAVLSGECPDYDYAMLHHSGLCARAERFVRMFIGRFAPVVPMTPAEWEQLKRDGLVVRWHAWTMHEMKARNYRHVQVVTDCVRGPDGTGGNAFKSHYCEWFPKLMANVGIKVQCISPGKLADMANELQSDTDIVLMDVPASRSDATFQWSFIEQLKCGRVASPKYHSTSVVMTKKPVGVIILCNQHPDVRRRPDFEEYFNDQGHPIDGYGRPRPREYTLSSDRWREYHITSDHDVEPVPDFMLPAEFGFGPEFSSDNAGDGPTALVLSDFWLQFVNHYEEHNSRWNVARQVTGKVFNKWHNKYSPFAVPLNRYFRNLGWDGVGDLEVGLEYRDSYFCDTVDSHGQTKTRTDFTVFCLERGNVEMNTPRGVVIIDSQGRLGRVYFNDFGDCVAVHALDPRECEGLQWGVFVRAYAITRGQGIIWSWREMPDFMDVDMMNGKFSPMPVNKP